MSDFSIKLLEIAGLGSALQALRLPFGKDCRSEVCFSADLIGDKFKTHGEVKVNEKDLALLSTLVKRGDEHAKVLRGVVVWVEINAPRYLHAELDTYSVGAERLSSESTMHTLGTRGVTIDDFAIEDEIKELLREKVKIEQPREPLYFEPPEHLECRAIEKFGRKYEVWNDGRIYALPFEVIDSSGDLKGRNKHFPKRLLRPGGGQKGTGYYQVGLGGRKGRAYLIHRLMAEAFVPNPNNYPVVNHIDGNKSNCSPSNLEWCTSSQNNQHAFKIGLKKITDYAKYCAFKRKTKFSLKDILHWKELRKDGLTLQKIADMYNTRPEIVGKYTKEKFIENWVEKNAIFYMAQAYEETIDKLNAIAADYRVNKSVENLMALKSLLPESFMQKRIWIFSYQTLRRIYWQRRNHRLPTWHRFCEFIETLPYADELILAGL